MSNAFEPRFPFKKTDVMVTPAGSKGAEPKPIEYYLNGFKRHREKLTAFAGNYYSNK